jgi:hypothetical protein
VAPAAVLKVAAIPRAAATANAVSIFFILSSPVSPARGRFFASSSTKAAHGKFRTICIVNLLFHE